MTATSGELIQELLGYRFTDQRLLLAALTHRSHVNEQKGEQSSDNERLEFLGDAVLNLVVSTALYRLQPQLSEGEMTRQRAEIVNAAVLARMARKVGLGSKLRLGRGEEKTGGRNKDNILADALEALLGAIYCEAGFSAAEATILQLFGVELQPGSLQPGGSDYKTRLQELLQARRLPPLEYRLVATSGPDHERTFSIEVWSAQSLLGFGEGRSKKEAEQAAALVALSTLESR